MRFARRMSAFKQASLVHGGARTILARLCTTSATTRAGCGRRTQDSCTHEGLVRPMAPASPPGWSAPCKRTPAEHRIGCSALRA